MTKEFLDKANNIEGNISACALALKYQTHGVYHRYADGTTEQIRLPFRVCDEIRAVIEKYKEEYEKELSAL